MPTVMRNTAWRRPVALKGERVTLRTARTSDQSTLERLRADQEIDYFMGVDSAPGSLLWRHVYLGDQSGALTDLVILGPQDQPIGLLSLWDRTIPHQAAELSIWIGASLLHIPADKGSPISPIMLAILLGLVIRNSIGVPTA